MISAGAGASGASGMAVALPANKAAAKKALVRIVFMMFSGAKETVASMGGRERNAGAHLRDRLVDQAERLLAVAALVWRRGGDFGTRVLQQADAGLHVRLGADGISDAHAGGERGT